MTPSWKREATQEEKELILKFFLEGNGINQTVFLMDYKLTADVVNTVIRQALRDAMVLAKGLNGIAYPFHRPMMDTEGS